MKHCERFETFLTATQEERERAKLRRSFRDLKQWTDNEVETLQERKQAAVVVDYLAKKVDSLCGLENQQRSDPKAYPRTPKHEKASEAITDALRFVEYDNNLDEVFSESFEEKIVEGVGGVIVEAIETPKGFDVLVKQIHWDRLYYDPRSREKNFSDSGYFGITIWMDFDDAKETFKTEDFSAVSGAEGNFEDRPRNWIDHDKKRVRVNQEYYLEKGVWKVVYYSGHQVLREPADSPWLDDDGKPCCPIELDSDFVDSDNNRYGYIERLMDQQREINHRRSKALYMLSSAQITYEDGAVDDIEEALHELRKAQGAVRVNPGLRFDVDRNIEMGTAQLNFYQEAKAEIDSVGFNPELAGRTEQAISGRAFIARQQSGMVELSRIYGRHANFKRRVYKQVWYRIKQFWDEEKWLRVTDDEDAYRWVGLNVPVTEAQKIVMDETGLDLQEVDQKYGQEILQVIQQNPKLGRIVETINNVPEVDMDILIEDAPDTLLLQMEQFDTLANLASSRGDPQMFEALLELSTIKNKDKVLERFKPNEEQEAAQAQATQEALEIEKQTRIADIKEKLAKAANYDAKTQSEKSETAINLAKLETGTF